MTVGNMLDILKGMASCKIEHIIDPSLMRPSDVTLQIPDISKFHTGNRLGTEDPAGSYPE